MSHSCKCSPHLRSPAVSASMEGAAFALLPTPSRAMAQDIDGLQARSHPATGAGVNDTVLTPNPPVRIAYDVSLAVHALIFEHQDGATSGMLLDRTTGDPAAPASERQGDYVLRTLDLHESEHIIGMHGFASGEAFVLHSVIFQTNIRSIQIAGSVDSMRGRYFAFRCPPGFSLQEVAYSTGRVDSVCMAPLPDAPSFLQPLRWSLMT
jgi:hypothetical protein